MVADAREALLEPIIHARREVSVARGAVGVVGLLLALTEGRALHPHPPLAVIGFLIVIATSAVQIARPDREPLVVEEAIAASAAVFLVGLAGTGVTVLSLLWLCSAGAGVVARAGRVGHSGQRIVILSLAMPALLAWRVEPIQIGLSVAAVALLLTCGRLTEVLNGLLGQARHDADHDALTGAWSRNALRRLLAGRLAAGEAIQLLLVDLDDFGVVNKSRGHAAGDELLCRAVARLRAQLPEGAVLGRLGGDEFAVLHPAGEPPLDGAALVRALGTPDEDGGPAIASSCGSASAPQDGADADSVLRAADVALRVAKRHGKGQAISYDAASLTDSSSTGAHAALTRLIAGDGIEIVVQPIVDVLAGTTPAYEALARFKTRGTQSPLHWFALADEFGMRADLEIACLRAALALFPQRPAGARLTVNLSAPLLLDDRVSALLDASGDLDGLIVEVTEGSLVQEDAGLLRAIAKLLERGIVLAIDDVGAGYSGLGQLTALRPALVKLDRRMTTGITPGDNRAALVEALVGYARRTEGEIVAEGIETAEELEAVAALGVRLVQGYFVARPGEPWPEVDVPALAAPVA